MRLMMMELAKPPSKRPTVSCEDEYIDCSKTQNKGRRKKTVKNQLIILIGPGNRTSAFILNVIPCRPCLLAARERGGRRHGLNLGHSSCLSLVSLCHRTPAQPQSRLQLNITQWLPLCSLEGTFPSKPAPSHAVFCTR